MSVPSTNVRYSQDRIDDAVADDRRVVDLIDDIADRDRGRVGLGRHREAAVGCRDRVRDAGRSQRIGGAVADELSVQRVDLVDEVLDDDDVALA